MFRTRLLALAACVAGLTSGSLLAADPAATIAPYLDEGTIAVARVDLTKVNVAATWKFFTQFVPVPEKDVKPAEEKLSGMLNALRNEKVDEIYFVASLADVPRGGPFAIVPVGSGGNYQRVAAVMFSGNPKGPTTHVGNGRHPGPFKHCEQLGNVVFCGVPETCERLKSMKPVKRPDLATAFKAAGDSTVQVVLTMSKEQHRVLSELMPRLPQSLGGMDGKEIAKALQWVSLGVQLPPKPKATLIVSAADEASAKRLNAAVTTLARTFSNYPDIKRNIKDLEKLIELLTPKVQGNRLVLSFDAGSKEGQQVVALFGTAVGQARAAAKRVQSRNNLKQLGLAMHNFHDTYKGFPPHASFNKDGKRLLSWRVYLLPFLAQDKLFKQFHLDEPWDSKHNKKLIAKMPPAFGDPTGKAKPGTTRYLAPLGPKNLFDGKEVGIRIRDITDGTSNTIMFVEAAPEKAVIWTKPDDITVDTKNPMKGLVAKGAKGFEAGFADGSVRFLSKAIKPDTLRAMFTRNGGEVIP